MGKCLLTISILTGLISACHTAPNPAGAKEISAPQPTFDTGKWIDAWVEMWNTYDLSQVEELFVTDDTVTYFSSEKQGLIRGIDAVIEHHRGFGFVKGGKTQSNKLWVEDLQLTPLATGAVVSGTWFFEKQTGRLQRGPVTFVYVQQGDEYRLSHLHFANYQPVLPAGGQAISLLGRPLYTPKLDESTLTKHTKNLEQARIQYEADPDAADALIWYGRRTAYLGRYTAAIDIFTKGIENHPDDPRMYRHRGHRYITIRKFDSAIDDLAHAAHLIRGTEDQIEPDGLPNAKNIPTSTLHFNIHYHLGLAYYLSGKLQRALDAYRDCLKVSKNPDSLVATTHWLYMTLRLLNKEDQAKGLLEPITAEMAVIESFGYHQLALFYKGALDEKSLLSGGFSWIDDPAVKYGLANWHHYNGRTEQAMELLKELIASSNWATFGHVAAEADLSRL